MAEGKQMLMEMAASAKRKEAAALKDAADAAAKEAAKAEECATDEEKCDDPNAPPPPPAAPPPPPPPAVAANAETPVERAAREREEMAAQGKAVMGTKGTGAEKAVKPYDDEGGFKMPELPELKMPELKNPFGGLFGGDDKKD